MKDMRDPKDLQLSVTNVDGDQMTLTLAWDMDLEGLTDAFRTIAFWLTFMPGVIDEYLPDPAREWAYKDEPDEHGPEGDD